jgi:hypothetical protein
MQQSNYLEELHDRKGFLVFHLMELQPVLSWLCIFPEHKIVYENNDFRKLSHNCCCQGAGRSDLLPLIFQEDRKIEMYSTGGGGMVVCGRWR